MARRKGDKWYVGGITNDRSYTTEIALDFLPAGRTFTKTSFEDGVNADLQATDYRKRVREVDASTVVKVEMPKSISFYFVVCARSAAIRFAGMRCRGTHFAATCR